MLEIKKEPLIKKRSLFKSSDKLFQSPKHLSHNYLYLVKGNNHISSKSHENKKISLNIIDFISQKKKFSLKNYFDMKGAREFLASKELAMMEIKLCDEIAEIEHNNSVEFTNKNNSPTKESTKKIKKGTSSPRKSRKSQYNYLDKNSKNLKNNCISEVNNDGNNIGNNCIFNKEDNDEIYKFFIENANDQEEIFQIKLKKELEKFEKIKKEKEKNKSGKNLEYKRRKKMNSLVVLKKKNISSTFLFSEINKNNMSKDSINLSSIGENEKDKNNRNIFLTRKNNKNKIKKGYGSVKINNQQIKERIKNKMNKCEEKSNSHIYSSNIDSDKESLMSILSNLI